MYSGWIGNDGLRFTIQYRGYIRIDNGFQRQSVIKSGSLIRSPSLLTCVPLGGYVTIVEAG
jgi:hypothetical protein